MTKFSKPIISIIAAIARNDRAIGYQNRLLWDIPADMQNFKNITKGHPVIMGQKTYESIGKPLPDRLNIIVTRDKDLQIDSCTIANSVEESINLANASIRHAQDREIFFIGGGQIYQQAIKFADRLYLTLVDGEYNADTYFPDYSKFKKVISSEVAKDNGYTLEYVIVEK